MLTGAIEEAVKLPVCFLQPVELNQRLGHEKRGIVRPLVITVLAQVRAELVDGQLPAALCVMAGGNCILVVGVIGLRIHRRKRAHEQDGKDELARRWAHKKTGLYGLFQANVDGIILRLANA